MRHARAGDELVSVLEELHVVDVERFKAKLPSEKALAADDLLSPGVVYGAIKRARKAVPR